MIKLYSFVCMIIGLMVAASLCAREIPHDMRKDYTGLQSLEEQHRQLVEKSENERKMAMEEARQQREKIKNDRAALKKAIADLKKNIAGLNAENRKIRTDLRQTEERAQALRRELDETGTINREFSGFVRANAKDLKTLLLQSLQSGLVPGRHKFLEPVIHQQKFPSMEDVEKISACLFDEIAASGRVNVTKGMIIDRQGRDQEARLLILGNFTGIYHLVNGETGFLVYSDKSQRFFALSKLPSAEITHNIISYLNGESDGVYLDITKGAAIRQLAHELDMMAQIPKGGPIVWPILGILGVALVIIVERILFFTTRRTDPEKLMKTVNDFVIARDWDGCRKFLQSFKNSFTPQVLLTALDFRDRTREDMENALQEAILGKIPEIERFLSTLGMLAAIAPLLGLLGTVTGMINTFHVITCFGTKDPRMMAGGISEALVTTMLGLCVAIPIMMVHTLLSRRVETQISQMEEKSVAFVNMIFKNRVK